MRNASGGNNVVMCVLTTLFFCFNALALSPPHVRQHECFQHRLCMRVKADVEEQTLTITDLGSGMTRADLINSLGIGRQLQSSSSKKQSQNASEMYESTDDEEDESSEEEDDEEEEEEEGEEDQSDESENNKQPHAQPKLNNDGTPETVSCKVSDVGGFYAAVCALGVGVRLGTKVK